MEAIVEFLMFLVVAIFFTAVIAMMVAAIAIIGKTVWDYFMEE